MTQFITVSGIQTAELLLPDTESRGTIYRAPAHAVLLLHGWGANLKLMQPLGERLAALGFSAYMPDLPGFGESDPPPTAWSVSDYANFIIAYLDAHQLQQVYLIGHSFGGRIGLVLGADHAERFVKFALADAAGVPAKKSHLPTFA